MTLDASHGAVRGKNEGTVGGTFHEYSPLWYHCTFFKYIRYTKCLFWWPGLFKSGPTQSEKPAHTLINIFLSTSCTSFLKHFMAYFEPYSLKVPETWTSPLAEKEKITEGSSPFTPVIEAEQNCSHHFLSFSSYISLSPSLSLKRWHWLAHCSPAVNNWCLQEAESIGYQYCSEPHRANVQFGKSVTKCGKERSEMLECVYCIIWSNSVSHCGARHP